MSHAPRPPFKHQAEIEAATHPKSSKREIESVWKQFGYILGGPVNSFNSGHFLLSALATIQTEQQVLDFIDSLDKDCEKQYGKGQKCTKARVARRQLEIVKESNATVNGLFPDKQLGPNYTTALHCLARRTCCSCHETGSYAARH